MRPTSLQFRSTKEKTPLCYNSTTSYDGRNISFQAPKGNSKRSNFNCEKRFIAYDILAKRTGYRVGPGSYSPELNSPRIRSGSPYRPFHLDKETSNNGYYMVGDTMEFEPGLMLNTTKKLQQERNIAMDATYLSYKSAKTASTSMSFDRKPVQEIHEDRRFSMYQPKNKKSRKRKTNIDEMIKRRFIN